MIGNARQEAVPAAQEPEELVEAALHRVGLRSDAQVPLAHHPGHITGGLQVVRERGLLEREVVLRLRLVACRAKTLLVPPGQQSRPGRAAPGTGHVAVREPHAAGGQGVETRRRDVLDALESEIRVAEIVGHDQQDVGLAVCRRCGKRRAAKRDGGKAEACGARSGRERRHGLAPWWVRPWDGHVFTGRGASRRSSRSSATGVRRRARAPGSTGPRSPRRHDPDGTAGAASAGRADRRVGCRLRRSSPGK